MTFEDTLKELQDIVLKMEDKNTTLDKSLELFNLGVEKSSTCMKILNESKGKVELLVKELENITKVEMEVK